MICKSCPSGTVFNATSVQPCIPCPADKQFVVDNICTGCPNGTSYSSTSKVCIQCPDGSKFNPNTSQCLVQVNGTLNPCSEFATYNSLTKQCQCPLDMPHDTGRQCVVCTPPSYWDSLSRTCKSCSDGTIFNLNTNNCQKCPTNAPIELNGVCTQCPSGTFFSSEYNICLKCATGSTYDAATNSCKLPVDPNSLCKLGATFDQGLNACKCPVGTF